MHYEGSLEENGEVFDSSREDDAVFTFEVGKGKVLRAWEMGVKSMKVGGGEGAGRAGGGWDDSWVQKELPGGVNVTTWS